MERERLKQNLFDLCDNQTESEIVSLFRKRIRTGDLTIQENPESHFCVYFAAFDSSAKKVFIGHHKKSGLWLFNGGHIDKGEGIYEALGREIGEEWGLQVGNFDIKKPELLTITEINNPSKQTCKRHYDIWFFIDVKQDEFNPDKSRVLEEFHQVGWKSYEEAKSLVKEKNTLAGIEFVFKK
jgi:8-oxo-dGTP pyrophosphatase MutT (NUDIX family)